MQANRYRFDRQFSEFKIRNLVLRNRIVFLPHYTAFAEVRSLPTLCGHPL